MFGSCSFAKRSTWALGVALVTCGALSVDSPARAEAPATQPSTQPAGDEVQALIDGLSSTSWAARDAAQHKLVGLGDSAEPVLKEALARKLDEETRTRVEAALQRIEENKLLGATIITLHAKDEPANDVLTDFARQAHADFGLNRPAVAEYLRNRPAVTLDVDHKPFWEAMKLVGDATGLRPSPYSGEPKMTLDPDGGGMDWLASTRQVTAGPFIVCANSCQDTRIISYVGGGNTNNSFTLTLVAMAEPKLKILNSYAQNWLTECVDDKGNSLMPANHMSYGFSNGRAWWWNLQSSLKEPKEMGTRIARLRGTLKCSVQVKSETVEIDDIKDAKDVTKTAGGITITIRSLQNNNGSYQLTLSMTSAPFRGPGRWDQIQSIASNIQLLDAGGTPLQFNGTSSTNFNGNQMTLQLTYSPLNRNGQNAEPKKLVWEVPTETKELAVPFELTDLALPR